MNTGGTDSCCLWFRRKYTHREPTQAASLVVCSKYKEMYGKILKSLTIVKLYRGMFKLKVEINVNLPQLLCIVVSVALNGEFERFGGFCVSNSQRKTHQIAQIRHLEPQKRQYTTTEVGLHLFRPLS